MTKKQKKSQLTEDQPVDTFKDILKILNKSVDEPVFEIPFQQTLATDVKNWFSTGDDVLDLYISNRKHGGIPGNRVIELNGLEQCVTKDTVVNILLESADGVLLDITCVIDDIKFYLDEEYVLYIKGYNIYTKDIEYSKVNNFFEKGELETYEVTLNTNEKIRVSENHRFLEQERGWISCKELIQFKSCILCDNKDYHIVTDVIPIGKHEIVDINVEKNHNYFGNGILNHNSGKSLLCSHLIKSCQQQNGIPVLIDTQGSISKQFLQAIGVNLKNVIISQKLKTMEKIYSFLQKIAYALRSNLPDVPILFIIDSITAATTQKDLENVDYENKGYQAGIKAKQHSQALRRWSHICAQMNICFVETSQLRADMNVMNPYMDPYQSSSGGMALKFYASLRLRLKKKSKIKQVVNNVEQVVGVRSQVAVQKSRIGPSYRSVSFDVYYDSGIANYTNWLQTLKKYKVITGKGTKNIPFIVEFEDQKIQIPGKFEKIIRQDQQIRNKIYDVLAELIIMKYRNIKETEGREVIIEDQDD